jgi:peptidoglycan/LPS O-acetylase OafA/YrhL
MRVSERRHRPDIDGLRCVAIVPVVLAHAGFDVFSGGYVGVDVFFVISGFLITRILWDDLDTYPASLLNFYERRARRILPALTAAMAATLAAGFATLGPQRLAELGESAIATALFLSNVWFWNTSSDYFGADVRVQPLLHTWSLAVEEQFYLLFPLLMALVARAGRRWVLPVIGLISIGSLAMSQAALAGGRQEAAFYLLNNRAWELGLGAALALGRPPLPPGRWSAEILAVLAAALILVPVVTYDAATPFPGLATVPPCLGTAMLIWLNAGTENRVKAVLVWRPVVAIGLVSYSVYVWHWPIIVFDRVLNGEATPLRALAIVALSLATGALSWRFVEQPFRVPGGPLRGRGAAFLAAGAATAAVTVAGAAISLSGGLPGRLPPAAARAFAAADDLHPVSEDCRGAGKLGAAACRFGAPADGPANFLLWGDSHAGALLPAVERAAEAAGKSGFVASTTACAPLLGVDRVDSGPAHRCSDFNDAVLAFLEGRDDMPTVILAGRWALAAEGTRGEEPDRPALLADRARAMPSGRPADNLAVFEAGIAGTVAAIRASGRRVVILGSVPEIGWSVPEGLGESLLLGRPPPPAPDAEAVAARNARAEAILREQAAAPGVAFVPLAPTLCTPACAVADAAGRPAYSDAHHLSRTGAAELLAKPVGEGVWAQGR